MPRAAAASRSTSTAVATKKSNNNVVSSAVQSQIDEMIAKMEGRVGRPSGDVIKLNKNKEFELPDGRTSSEPLRAIVLDFVSTNSLYEGKYNPDNPTPPVCFAIGQTLVDMTPSQSVPAKDRQSDKCATCPMNQFGSDGNGKACKNSRLLAIVPEGFDADTPIMVIKVSPTAIKYWDKYVASLATTQRKVCAQVLTEISFDEASEYQTLRFRALEPLDAGTVASAFSRIEEAQKRLSVEPDLNREAAPAKPAARSRKPARR